MTEMQEIFTSAGWMPVEDTIHVTIDDRSNRIGKRFAVAFYRKHRSTAAVVECLDKHTTAIQVGIVSRYVLDGENPRLGRKLALAKALKSVGRFGGMDYWADREAIWAAVLSWEASPPLAGGDVVVEAAHQAPERLFGAPGMGRMKLPGKVPLVDSIASSQRTSDQVCS